MNTEHLKYVLEVYRCGSLNRAAKACFISQSHLSKIIKDLESELGFELFTRSANGIVFNRNGLYFIDSAEKIVNECNKIYRIPKMVSDNSCMHIVSSPSPIIMQSFLCFRKPSADTDLSDNDIFKESGLNDILQQVISRETPLGIMTIFSRMAPKYAATADRYGLSFDLIKDNIPIKVLMSVRHPLAKLQSIQICDLERYPFVLDGQIDETDTLVGLLKLKQSRNSLIVSNRAGRMDAVRSGYYICHTTGNLTEEQEHSGFCMRPIADFHECMAVYSLKYANRSYSVRESEFICYLRDRL